MYHSGQDIGALVGDLGSTTTKIGLAGEDFPRCYFSSAVGLTVDAEATAAARKAGSSAAAASDAMDVADDDEDSTVHKYHVDAVHDRTDMELQWPHNPIDSRHDVDLLERIWEYAASYKVRWYKRVSMLINSLRTI
eukprot:7430-Heterococcus_DN1.PRE.1